MKCTHYGLDTDNYSGKEKDLKTYVPMTCKKRVCVDRSTKYVLEKSYLDTSTPHFGVLVCHGDEQWLGKRFRLMIEGGWNS